MAKRIYAADDEENIRDVLKSFLEDAGYETKVFSTGDELYDHFAQQPCDLVILDIMMPGTDGLTICKKLRGISNVPIIILTAKDSEMDYCMGMSYGGDDYLMKPFRPSILIMRIKALFRRIEMEHAVSATDRSNLPGADPDHATDGSGNEGIPAGTVVPEHPVTASRDADPSEAEFGDLFYSGGAHQISCSGKDLGLTMTEFALLRYMILNKGRAISREELLDKIWGIQSEVETRVTDETVRRIRKKLKNHESRVGISVIWGYGYKLEELQ